MPVAWRGRLRGERARRAGAGDGLLGGANLWRRFPILIRQGFLISLLRALHALVPRRYVIVHGFYGAGNVGDEAILAATLEQVRATTELEPFVFAWGPERVRTQYGVRSLDPNAGRPLSILSVLLRAEVYVLGGGGIIKDWGGTSASLLRWLRWIDLASRLGAKTMTWSVGVENLALPESQAWTRNILGRVDVVTLRDHNSAGRLRELGLTRELVVTADPATAAAMGFRGPARRRGTLRVAVSVRHWYTTHNAIADPAAFGSFLAAAAEACDQLHDRYGAGITFVPLRTSTGDDDRVVAAAIKERMRTAAGDLLTNAAPSVDETVRRLADADVVMAMRLHAAIIATTLGIPTLAIAYMPKVRDYMAEIGQERLCARVEDVTPDWVMGRIAFILDHYDALCEDLRIRTDALASAYLRNAELLRGLLSDRTRTRGAADRVSHPHDR